MSRSSWCLLAYLGLVIARATVAPTASVCEEDELPQRLATSDQNSHSGDRHKQQGACLLQVAQSHKTLKAESSEEHKKTLVEVFYETKCPYSIDFLNTTLREAWDDQELWKKMDVKLYPFGNAMLYSEDMISKGYHYWHPKAKYPLMICQHGETECLGNLIHACAIKELKDSRKYVPFVICMANFGINAGAELSSYQCGKDLDINMDDIKACVDSQHGLDVMVAVAGTTRTTNVSHVPWVEVNGEHTQNDTMILPVCNLLKGSKPKACKKKKEGKDKGDGGGSGPCLTRMSAPKPRGNSAMSIAQPESI